MAGLDGVLLVDDAAHATFDHVVVGVGELHGGVSLGLVLDDGAVAGARLHALHDVGAPDGAAVGDGAVGIDHLHEGDQQVSLPDADVAVVAALPAALLVGHV